MTTKYKAGGRVKSVGGMTGTVVRWINGADGGCYRVKWDNGHSGLIAPINLRPEAAREAIRKATGE